MPECKDRHFLSSTRKLQPQLLVPGPSEWLGQRLHKKNVIARESKPRVFLEPCPEGMKVTED